MRLRACAADRSPPSARTVARPAARAALRLVAVELGALACAALASAMVAPTAGAAGDWLQFQYDSANRGRASSAHTEGPGATGRASRAHPEGPGVTGRAPEPVEPPFRLRWVWYGEDNVVVVGRRVPKGEVPRPPGETVGLLSFTMHAVVAHGPGGEGRVVFGDLTGNLFCLSARDGSTAWKARVPGAFVHAPGIALLDGGNVIVAPCQDGYIHGFSWEGDEIWRVKARRPFVTPAKIARGVAYAGSLDGTMYAVDVATGRVVWTFDARAPIRQPAAVGLDARENARVFFGSEDMVFHALDADTGKEIWRTARGHMKGQSFRNTWPVVVGDKVMTFQILVDGAAEFVMEALLFNATPGGAKEKRIEDWPAERDAILKWLEGDMTHAVDCNKGWQKDPGKIRPGTRSARFAGGPFRKTFFVFDVEGDGRGGAREPYQVPMGIVGGTGNSNMGPTVDAKGRPLLWWRVSASSIITGGGFGTSFSPDLSALDLATGDRIILPTERDIHKGGPGMELDNHHMLTSAGEYVYYHNPFRQARWVKLDGKANPSGSISAVYRRHDGGGWDGDVVYYPGKGAAGRRGVDTHGSARTPVVIADGALFVNELDIRALACYEPDR